MPATTPHSFLLDGNGLYLTGEDNLRLTTFGRIAGAEVALEGRRISPEGIIVPFAERQQPTSDGTAKATVYQIGEGLLTNAQLRATAGSVLGGGVFGILEVVRGREGGVQPLGTLLQGYVTTNARLAWPGSPILPSTAGAGRLRSITGTNPAAGVEISEAVPAGVRWRISAITFALTTDATVANRFVGLKIDDGVNALFVAGSNVAQAASGTTTYTGAAGLGAFGNATNALLILLPDNLVLPAGSRIRTTTAALQAGDDYGAPQYLVEEFIE